LPAAGMIHFRRAASPGILADLKSNFNPNQSWRRAAGLP